MKVSHDTITDSKYVSVKRGKVFKTKSLEDWLMVDFNKKGEILGVEILNASKNLVSIQVDNTINYVSIQKLESQNKNDIGNLEAKLPAMGELSMVPTEHLAFS